MTTETIAAAGRTVLVRMSRAEDGPVIRGAMLESLRRGEYDAMEPHQVVHAAERIVAHPTGCAVAEMDGRLAGWVVPADDDLVVLPPYRRRGIGRRLVSAGQAIAAAEGRAHLRLWVRARPESEAFARACGLRYDSSVWQMRLARGDVAAVPGPTFPEGTAIRSLRPGHDDLPFVALVNRIFLDHPSPVRLTAEEVRRPAADFDPTAVLVVEDMATRDMVAFCRVVRYAAGDGSPEGEVRLLGVDRHWRGKGLGRAVTAWGVAELRHRGAEAVVLAVEGENTAARNLYADLGFRVVTQWRHWVIPTAANPAV